MKKFTRILSALIASLFVISAICSCQEKPHGSEKDSTATTTKEEISTNEAVSATENSSESETELISGIEKKNYNSDFNVLTLKDMFPADYFFTEENTYDDMTDAVYTRMQNVNEHLGIELVSIDAGAFTEYVDTVKTCSKNNEPTYSLVLTHVYYGLSNLILENYLHDFNELESVNLKAPYWNTSLMEELSLKDKVYLGYSDFNLAYVYVITFNKSMYEDILNAENVAGKTVYQYVNDYEWTIDKMFAIASEGKRENGDNVWDEKDTYGFTGTCWVEMCNFLQSSNIQLVGRNESNEFVLSCLDGNNASKTSELVQKLTDYYNAEYTYLWSYSAGEDSRVHMESGRALFEMSTTFRLKGLTSFDVKFGVLPYPMYDEAQKDNGGYRELNWGGFMCVPEVQSNNYDMISDTVELLSFYSAPVTVSFYETLLGKKIAEAPEDTKMLKLIWASVCSDVGLTYSSIGGSAIDPFVYTVPRCILENKSFTTFARSYKKSAEVAIKKYLNVNLE